MTKKMVSWDDTTSQLSPVVEAALAAKYIQRWTPNTVYALDQQVVSPNNDVVKAIAAFTSGTTYNATQWSPSTSYALKTEVMISQVFSYTGPLLVGPGRFRWYNPTNRTLTFAPIRASVTTVSAGASIIVDITKNGVSVFTSQANRPTIAIGANTALSGTPDLTWAPGEYLVADLDQVGSMTPGSDLTVQVQAS